MYMDGLLFNKINNMHFVIYLFRLSNILGEHYATDSD